MQSRKDTIVKIATEVINQEASAVQNLISFVDEQFIKAVELIYNCKGRLIITGIGKSAIIANKIVATMNSTGTPAIFMHAADAIHGDLGYVLDDDIVMCISKSGNTPEIKVLVPFIERMGNKIIAIVSSTDSFLAKHADCVVRATVEKESDPNNLAPTSSTTTQLVMGDALACSLLKLRGFTGADFAKYHPGGSLGKRLYLRVSDVMDTSVRPFVNEGENIQNTIINISQNRLGATVVLSDNEELLGIITDGDVRRMIQRGEPLERLRAKDVMSKSPKTIDLSELAVNAFNLMQNNKITSVVVMNQGKYVGLVHIHDILREGFV